MRITYDASADAAYFYLSDRTKCVKTKHVDDDINIDFNERDQMVGIEVLGASKRLRLSDIAQTIENLDTDWVTLSEVLKNKKAFNIPISVSDKGEKVWVEDINYSYVIVRGESGKLRKINAYQLLGSPSGDPLVETLCKIGNYTNGDKVI